MLKLLTRGEAREEDGFTLIELMVVVLIMGILMAIAIPTFLSTTNGANKTAATSNATNAFTAVKAYYDSNGGAFPTSGGLQTAMTTNEPEFSWTTGSPAEGQGVSVWVPTSGNVGQEVVLGTQAKSTNNCYYIDDIESYTSAGAAGGVLTAAGVAYGETNTAPASGACAADPTSGVTWTATESSGWPK